MVKGDFELDDVNWTKLISNVNNNENQDNNINNNNIIINQNNINQNEIIQLNGNQIQMYGQIQNIPNGINPNISVIVK